jgi:hypothetical protein
VGDDDLLGLGLDFDIDSSITASSGLAEEFDSAMAAVDSSLFAPDLLDPAADDTKLQRRQQLRQQQHDTRLDAQRQQLIHQHELEVLKLQTPTQAQQQEIFRLSSQADASGSTTSLPPPPPPLPPPLPQGWSAHQAPSGAPFYVHIDTNTSHWTLPDTSATTYSYSSASGLSTPRRSEKRVKEESPDTTPTGKHTTKVRTVGSSSQHRTYVRAGAAVSNIAARVASVGAADDLKAQNQEIKILKGKLKRLEANKRMGSPCKSIFRNSNAKNDKRYAAIDNDRIQKAMAPIVDMIKALTPAQPANGALPTLLTGSKSGVSIEYRPPVIKSICKRFNRTALSAANALVHDAIVSLLPLKCSKAENRALIWTTMQALPAVPEHFKYPFKSDEGQLRKHQLLAYLVTLFPGRLRLLTSKERVVLLRLLGHTAV